jgi:hypothetical protein
MKIKNFKIFEVILELGKKGLENFEVHTKIKIWSYYNEFKKKHKTTLKHN